MQRLYSADWDRPWGDETHSTLVFIGIQLPEEEFARRLPGYDANLPACALRRRPSL